MRDFQEVLVDREGPKEVPILALGVEAEAPESAAFTD
jgi:hypothetical protein